MTYVELVGVKAYHEQLPLIRAFNLDRQAKHLPKFWARARTTEPRERPCFTFARQTDPLGLDPLGPVEVLNDQI